MTRSFQPMLISVIIETKHQTKTTLLKFIFEKMKSNKQIIILKCDTNAHKTL